MNVFYFCRWMNVSLVPLYILCLALNHWSSRTLFLVILVGCVFFQWVALTVCNEILESYRRAVNAPKVPKSEKLVQFPTLGNVEYPQAIQSPVRTSRTRKVDSTLRSSRTRTSIRKKSNENQI